MFVKILAFLLIATPLFAQTKAIVVSDTSIIRDTYIRGFSDSLTNFGVASVLPVNSGTKVLFKFENLASAFNPNRPLFACTLFVQSYNDIYNTASGTITLYKMLTDWEEGSGIRRSGALWRYAEAPTLPDTIPASQLPSYFSWADSLLDSDAKDQYTCGSCYIFGAAAALEDALMIQNSERQLSYNSGNGVGCDRSGTNYSSLIVSDETFGDWETTTLPFKPLTDAYASSDNECGWTFIRNAGEYTFKTSESADASLRPRIFVSYTIDSSGTHSKTKQVTGSTQIYETVLKSGADSTTNFGSDTTIAINSTSQTLLIKINDVHTLFGNYVTSFDEVTCSLYVQTLTTNGNMWATRSLKKWVEGEASYVNWKTSNRWGLNGGLKQNSYDISEQHVLNCDPNQSCNGGSSTSIYNFWMANGVVQEANIPYSANDELSCTDTAGFSSHLIKWYWPIPYATPAQIKQQIIHRPVNIKVEDWDAQNSDCYVHSTPTLDIDHTLIAIGWCDTCQCGDSTGAFIVRNSHGESWGDNGIGYVSYNNNTRVLMSEGFTGAFIPETVTEPIMWSGAGTVNGTDVSDTAMSTVSVTTDEYQWYGLAIDTTLVRQWLSGGDNFGVMLKPTDIIFENNAVIGIGASEPSSRAGLPAKPRLVLYTEGTDIGNVKLGNVKIGK